MSNYSIREISEMFQLPPSTLRYYEDEGLLTNITRTPSGQRIYDNCHINRLKTICCFKNTGMTITQLKEFFSYESAETENIDSILLLLQTQKEDLTKQIARLQKDYIHLQKKLDYYSDIKKSIETKQPLPQWQDYKFRNYSTDD